MNANEPGYDELCMRTEGHGDEMPLTEGDGLWESFDALLEHANEAQLNQMIGRIKNHARKLVEEYDAEGRRIQALRQLVADMPTVVVDPKPAARAKRSDAGRKREPKGSSSIGVGEVGGYCVKLKCTNRVFGPDDKGLCPVHFGELVNEVGADPFDPIPVGYEGDA